MKNAIKLVRVTRSLFNEHTRFMILREHARRDVQVKDISEASKDRLVRWMETHYPVIGLSDKHLTIDYFLEE